MKKRLIIHIGANKTGSSAIQNFLAKNRKALLRSGVYVPGRAFDITYHGVGFHVQAVDALLKDPEAGAKRMEDAVSKAARRHPRVSTMVLSAESLSVYPKAPDLFARLVDDYEIRVVLYIRRQDELLLSSWQQWQGKRQADFWAWVVRKVGVLGNWKRCLRRWESVVPRTNIDVRRYEHNRLAEGDVVRDFYQLLGLEVPFEDWCSADRTVNPSLSPAVMELVEGNPLVFRDIHDNRFFDFVTGLTGDRYQKNRRVSPITFAQREALLHRYRGTNKWVRDAYFGEQEGSLFTPPRADDYRYQSEAEKRDEQLGFLTSLVYRMHQVGSFDR